MRLSDLQGFGNYTVKAIGESVGYKVYGTFINVFKKATGITPSMYQKLTLEEANMAKPYSRFSTLSLPHRHGDFPIVGQLKSYKKVGRTVGHSQNGLIGDAR